MKNISFYKKTIIKILRKEISKNKTFNLQLPDTQICKNKAKIKNLK